MLQSMDGPALVCFDIPGSFVISLRPSDGTVSFIGRYLDNFSGVHNYRVSRMNQSV